MMTQAQRDALRNALQHHDKLADDLSRVEKDPNAIAGPMLIPPAG